MGKASLFFRQNKNACCVLSIFLFFFFSLAIDKYIFSEWKKKSAALCKIGWLEFSLGPSDPRELHFYLIHAICIHSLSQISHSPPKCFYYHFFQINYYFFPLGRMHLCVKSEGRRSVRVVSGNRCRHVCTS